MDSFAINIKCPHCGKPLVKSYTGFAGELSNRHHECKYCEKDFYIHILAVTSKSKEIEDGRISGMRRRIKFLNRQRKETYVELLIKHEIAQKINKEALTMAEEMRRKRSMN